jgi:hypothetical protein
MRWDVKEIISVAPGFENSKNATTDQCEPVRYHGLRRTLWLAKKDGGDFKVGTELVFQRAFELSAMEKQ